LSQVVLYSDGNYRRRRSSVMNANYGREVRLSGEELERARTAERDVVSSLNSMAGLILDAMEEPSERTVSDDAVTYSYAAGTLIVHGPEYCYVYDGEAGVCRPCTPAEEAG
jgi:hypothetical protein